MESYDVSRSIRLAVDSGKVLLGAQESRKVALSGKARLIIVSGNCPDNYKQDVEHYAKLASIELMRFPGTSVELGTACGKPFPVSMMTVLEAGNSDILEIARRK
ncbi:MAG: 50S ribosomal protein L30e [Candidatus Micrarchaeia archaeon]|jgi:large subunit ribosomal protein L30e